MHILVTGGTGLIGSALILHPAFRNDSFTVLTRDRKSASHLENSGCKIVESLEQIDSNAPVNAVINLAGAQIVGKRWSDARKKTIRKSRIDLTRNLVRWMSTQDSPPQVLLSGSAIGFYGDSGSHPVTESSNAGDDFGAALCVDWENEAKQAEAFGTRVCLLRTGLVLSANGGMLKQLLLPFKLFLGSQLGNGRQWMSWIHIDDHIAIMRHLLEAADANGPYNLVAPEPVTNKQFTKTLATAVGRFSLLVAPAFAIKLALGEAASLLLGGQNVVPKKLQQEGFVFSYPELGRALTKITG